MSWEADLAGEIADAGPEPGGAKEGLGVGENEVRAAMEVLRRSVVGKNPPLVLAEFGPAMTDKYLFMRLDWVDQVQDAKAIGFRP